MQKFSFPLYKTKINGLTQEFNLDSPGGRQKYFVAKAGEEIERLRDWVKNNTFVAFLMGKKGSGKGTYAKMFSEIIGEEHLAHLSVGDTVRNVHKSLETEEGEKELLAYLRSHYRGFISPDNILGAVHDRDLRTLLPTEVILTLVEKEIANFNHKSLFIDGFPRNLDQIPYSLYLRNIIGRPAARDFFVFIDIPEEVIDERMKYRVVCPHCQTPGNLKLSRTQEIGYDQSTQQFYLKCDGPSCQGVRMVAKEGQELGLEALRERFETDEKVMGTLLKLEGVPKIFLRNALPVAGALDYVDTYEITPAYRYEWDNHSQEVRVFTEPWVVADGAGVPSYSLLAPPVTLSLIKQLAKVLGLSN